MKALPSILRAVLYKGHGHHLISDPCRTNPPHGRTPDPPYKYLYTSVNPTCYIHSYLDPCLATVRLSFHLHTNTADRE